MKKIYIIALISAAVCGVLLYSFFSGYEKKQEQVAETQVQETEQVVVAVKDIKGYTSSVYYQNITFSGKYNWSCASYTCLWNKKEA